MRMDLWVGTYLDSKCGFKGEGMPFFCRKEAPRSSALFDPNAFIPKADHIISRQNPIQSSKGNRYGKGETSGRAEPFD